MKQNVLEILMGAFVLILAGSLLIFAYTSSKSSPTKGYAVIAKFDRVDGLVVGSDIKMGGIKIGNISSLTLDPNTYLAVATLLINSSIKLPTDSSAQVTSDGLLGSKFLSIMPGAEDKMLAPGGEIQYTQSSVNLESLIGHMIYGDSKDKKEDKSNSPADDSPSPKT